MRTQSVYSCFLHVQSKHHTVMLANSILAPHQALLLLANHVSSHIQPVPSGDAALPTGFGQLPACVMHFSMLQLLVQLISAAVLPQHAHASMLPAIKAMLSRMQVPCQRACTHACMQVIIIPGACQLSMHTCMQAQPGALTPEQAEIKARVDAINTGNRSGAIATFPGSISTAVQPPRISLAINTGTGQAHFDQPLPSPRGSSHSNSQQPLQQPSVQLPHHPQLQGQGSQPLRAPSPAVQPAQQAAVHAHQQPAVQPAVRALSPPAQQAGSYASQEGAAQQAQPAAVQFTPPASAAAAAGLQALQAFSNGQLTAGNPAQLQVHRLAQ